MLAVFMAVFMRGQKTDRMFRLPLGLTCAQRVQYHEKRCTLCTRARCWMLRKPGDLPCPCPRPKNFLRLATRDTLHGSRPNLRQRDPKGVIVSTPPNVTAKGKVASTERCVRRKKMTIMPKHITETSASINNCGSSSIAKVRSVPDGQHLSTW